MQDLFSPDVRIANAYREYVLRLVARAMKAIPRDGAGPPAHGQKNSKRSLRVRVPPV